MTLNGIERLRNAFRALVDAEGLRPLAARTGIPVGQIRSLIDGRAVRVTTLELMTQVLGVNLTIGPGPAGEALGAGAHREQAGPGPDAAMPPESGRGPIATQLRDGAGRVKDLADRVAAAAQSLLHLVSGWDPAREAQVVIHAEGAPCTGSPVMIPLASGVRVGADSPEPVFEPSPEVTLGLAPDALPDWVRADRLVAIRATDDAMAGTIGDGDLVAVDCGHTTPLDNHLFAVASEGGVVVRRLRLQDGWILTADNAAHPDRPLSGGDHLLGRVAWHGPRRRGATPEG